MTAHRTQVKRNDTGWMRWVAVCLTCGWWLAGGRERVYEAARLHETNTQAVAS